MRLIRVRIGRRNEGINEYSDSGLPLRGDLYLVSQTRGANAIYTSPSRALGILRPLRSEELI